MIIILYNNTKNNLYIIPIAYINTIFKYNTYYNFIDNFIDNFTIISIHNDNVFGGNSIPDSHIKMLKILSKMILEKHNDAVYLKTEDLDFIRDNENNYNAFINTFTDYYNFDINYIELIIKDI
jgi:hypothetical protein